MKEKGEFEAMIVIEGVQRGFNVIVTLCFYIHVYVVTRQYDMKITHIVPLLSAIE